MENSSQIYICLACGYAYDPTTGDHEHGISAGIPFEQLPEEWLCPICGIGKIYFKKGEKQD